MKISKTTFTMASPRAILGFGKLAPHSPQHLRKIQFISTPKTPVRSSLNVDYIPPGKNLDPHRLSQFNVDTPNRMKILNNGLCDHSSNILGSGGFGTVFQACYKGDQVAAKIIRRRKDSDHSVNAEKHATSLRHDNIVRILVVEQGPALSMITMELCGKSLQERLDESPLCCKERVRVFKAIASALQFCHSAGVVHADIKPKNILMAADGNPKLTDFGSSFLLGEVEEKTGFRGTPGYAAPEIIRGEPPGTEADIYSLGVLAWQMLSRKLPFAELHPHTILYLTGKGMNPDDDELEDNLDGKYKVLYRKMWSFKRTDRPGMDAILIELKNFDIEKVLL